MTSKLGFSAEYVESISPVERAMYIQYYIREKKEEANRKQNTAGGPTIAGPPGE